MDWPQLIREFGLPLAMLIAFAALILTGRLLAAVAVAMLISLWAQRVEDWKGRALAAEARLDTALPLLGTAADELRKARTAADELRAKLARAGERS